ncbi:MAG: 16S rRNA (adenine(1518)-N(6)/adenine(1519)-N(6))-dimethyltransferase RsmA [Oscillospiraceae bacterium]|nr:16S rRNA (adenine(1518)-N(6)/adenine(1519)-N(6))-dimethyltransferase RsmA [Oscillospiraceae bacterium]
MSIKAEVLSGFWLDKKRGMLYTKGMNNQLCSLETIKRVLDAHGFRFDKRKGQNFLTASWVPERMAALFDKGQDVLEVGPGFGALTAALAQNCGHVTAIEKDRKLMPVLQENLSGADNVTLIEGDALKLDLAIYSPRAVCANLPYSITTPLLTRLLETGRFDPIVVMVQREVALRLTAKPDTPEYGAITVFTALHAACSILFDVSPGCFMPRPAVTSSVIRLDRLPPGAEREALIPKALRLVKAGFAQRRKTLLNALSAGLSLSKETTAAILTEADTDPSKRAETLSPEQFLTLARFF